MTRACSALALLVLAAAAATDEIPNSAGLRMNQIQIIATHNSYKQRPDEPLFTLVKAAYPDAATWDYGHPPLDAQLESGVRGFELDLYHDPDGIRVFHVPQFDMNSNCETLVGCLSVLRDWSRAHPAHVPLIVLLELKEEPVPQANIPVLPFDIPALEQLEAEVLSVFDADHLLRPDDVRGDAPALNEAIRTRGWPALDAVRGRVLLVLHTDGATARRYLGDTPALEGRPLFLEAHADAPHAAIFVHNDPADPAIPGRVAEGFMVRTRADANLKEANENDPSRREKALASGAQVISTDFPPGEAHPETGYVVEFAEGAVARANAVAGVENTRRRQAGSD